MTKRRMGVHHFTASEQFAIQFVVRYLVNPANESNSDWERPTWRNFVWFTEIISTPMETLEVNGNEAIQLETVERDVVFRLGKEPVVIVTLRGTHGVAKGRSHKPSIAWTICRVRYLLRWNTGSDDDAWVDREVDRKRAINSFSTLPRALAPVG